MDLAEFQTLIASARTEIGKAVQGQDALTDLLLVSVFARGHCLVEGPPGTAEITILTRHAAQPLEFEARGKGIEKVLSAAELAAGKTWGMASGWTQTS
ncbi:hypothetical protein [Cypionkella sp. TWP1-2-1b2]|uniref:hypothetical protein n=1 Tax=Cypionkella sp. TWP1-2-1b2 TaxID=2804675 RepID=UPI003CE852CD